MAERRNVIATHTHRKKSPRQKIFEEQKKPLNAGFKAKHGKSKMKTCDQPTGRERKFASTSPTILLWENNLLGGKFARGVAAEAICRASYDITTLLLPLL